MYPILFKIWNITFYSHGVLAVIGIVLGALVIFYSSKKFNLPLKFVLNNIIYSIFLGIIGARLTYFFLYREQFSAFREILNFSDGGLVSYGGIIMGGIALATLLKIQGQPISRWFDAFSIGFFGGLFIGRIGCVLAGENMGVWGSGFFNIAGQVPVTLYEAILCLIIFLLLIILLNKYKSKIAGGSLFIVGMILYSGGRFMIDFWRDESAVVYGISLGQITSLAIFIFFITAFISLRIKEFKKERV